MRKFVALILMSTLLAWPAFAQSPNDALQRGTPQEKPLDRGPFTPQASDAYHGGGVVLEGAPGAPAPAPQALPEVPTGTPVPR